MEQSLLVAGQLLEIGAVKFSADKPFTWTSGWKSPIYCDNRKILSFPELRNEVKKAFLENIEYNFPQVQCITGVATAGIPWGILIADALSLPFVYVRPQPKAHGLGNQIEGSYKPEMRAVVIEDLVSTGRSSLQVISVLKDAGFQVEGLLSVFEYGFPETNAAFEHAGIIKYSITDYGTLLQAGVEKGVIQANTMETLSNWSKDPEHWNL